MNKPLTVNDLLKYCQKEIKKGKGDYTIMLSNDDEGNGYHYLWYSFTTPSELCEGYGSYGLDIDLDGLDESIAPVNKTIILG